MLKSFDEMTPDQQLAYKMGYEAARSELRVAGPDDLVIRREDLSRVLALVDEQAEDEGLWFIARTAPEAYLQQELRRLHAAVESALAATEGET